MCGIVGYVGSREAIDFLLGGLRRLEYRGYDSSGVAIITPEGSSTVCKTAGRIDRLEARSAKSARAATPASATPAGPPTAPRASERPSAFRRRRRLAMVHNGVIENFRPLKQSLAERRLRVPFRHRHRSDRPPDRQLP